MGEPLLEDAKNAPRGTALVSSRPCGISAFPAWGAVRSTRLRRPMLYPLSYGGLGEKPGYQPDRPG